MSANGNAPMSRRSGEPTVLELGDDRTPPVFVWRGSLEESFRPVSTEDIQSMLNLKVMGPESRAAAIAVLARRGISPPSAEWLGQLSQNHNRSPTNGPCSDTNPMETACGPPSISPVFHAHAGNQCKVLGVSSDQHSAIGECYGGNQ